MVPSIRCREPVPEDAKQPQHIQDPPPCLAVLPTNFMNCLSIDTHIPLNFLHNFCFYTFPYIYTLLCLGFVLFALIIFSRTKRYWIHYMFIMVLNTSSPEVCFLPISIIACRVPLSYSYLHNFRWNSPCIFNVSQHYGNAMMMWRGDASAELLAVPKEDWVIN